MKKINTLILMAIMSFGSFMNYSCTSDIASEEVADNKVEKPTHHLGLYTMSEDLLEIYDAKVIALCDGQVVSTTNLKDAKVYSEADGMVSYNIDTYVTSDSVEYKLQLSCCKAENDLEISRDYELALNAQFISVKSAPEKALELLDETANDCDPQSLNGMTLQSYFGYGSEYSGQTVYEVWAKVNSKSFTIAAY